MSANRRRTLLLASLAMVAFAANSVLCRIALSRQLIDPASFWSVRLASGALMLTLVSRWRGQAAWPARGAAVAVAVLMLYGVPFSFAYTGLTAGTGALILFGCVQVTMFALARRRGERVHAGQWAGVALALSGLTYLVLPALSTPAFVPAVLMTMAGVFWGVYSWLGRAVARPLAVNTRNFVFALPLALAVNAGAASQVHVATSGVLLAIASGAIATGLGYVIWYAALPGLSGAEGAVVQLSVPLLAAAGGVLFLDEPLSLRLILSAAMVLGGVGLTVASARR